MKFKLFLFFVISFFIFSNDINTHGNLGYINTPSALSLEDGTVATTIVRSNPDRKLIVTASPFKWLDASIFYVDVTGREYNVFKQSYKDKGFSVKVGLPSIFNHKIAFGINDLAGTGLYSSEYFVITGQKNRINYSFGVGWGDFSNGIKFSNPLIELDQRFSSRSSGIKDKGGTVDINNYFSGNSASLFMGASYSFDRNNKIIVELDPTKGDRIDYPIRESKINFGYEKRIKDFSIKAAILGEENLNLQISYSTNFKKYNPNKKKFIRQNKNLIELIDILEKNQIGLRKYAANNTQSILQIRDNTFIDKETTAEITVLNAAKLAEAKDEVVVQQYKHGMKVSQYSHPSDIEKNPRNKHTAFVLPAEILYEENIDFPIFNQSLAPVLRNFVAAREGFYHGAILLEHNAELLFSENIIFLSNLKYSLIDDFDNLYIPPVDVYPKQVRSDIKRYLNGLSSGVSIGRFELNYFKEIAENHFSKISIGVFEEMFGGVIAEYVYNPKLNFILLGAEVQHVKKRSYDLNFTFQNYKNTLTRGNVMFIDKRRGIDLKFSYGEYLAGDIGYTFELTRRYKNGVEMSAFFSQTNVTAEQYGEGSFDKGVRLRIPFEAFNIGLTDVVWRPLTKDPAALLIKGIDLMSEVRKYK